MNRAMSSPVLREIPLPDLSLDENTRSHSNNLSFNASRATEPSCCLCPHALAYQSHVYGRTTRRAIGKDTTDFQHETWLSWKTSLAPHTITQVVSNRDGSVLAAATDKGTVSLLRGSDGRVLATRQVAQTSTLLCFIPRFNDETDGDTLLIQTIVEDDDQEMQCVVVSNILGSKLNGMPESATEAARQMKIRALPPKTGGWTEIARVTALYKQPSVLLLLTVNLEGQLAAFDCHLDDGSIVLVKESISLQLSNDETQWIVDSRLGFMTQTQPSADQSYIVFAAYAPGAAALAWFNTRTLQCVCHIPLKVRSVQVGVFMPVPSPSSTLAIAVALRTENATKVDVFQLVLEETMGLTLLTKPHFVFSLPIDCPLHSVSLASTVESSLYGFAYQIARKGIPAITEVYPNKSHLASIGKIRCLIQMGMFDQADNILASLGEEVIDEMADFHPSEVASARLKVMVVNESTTRENLEACLERLANCAKTLNETAVKAFAEACALIPNQQIHKPATYQIAVIEQVLQFVAAVIDNVPSLDSSVVKDVENSLIDRRRALRFVAAIPSEQISVDLVEIESTRDLLAKLLEGKHYMLVEKLWDWEGGKCMSVDLLLTELVQLSSDVDPKGYLPLLKRIILPNLTIHHDLLPILRAWACDTADGMDENHLGLPSAISLLQTMQEAIIDLRQKLHSSFASHSPFVDGVKPMRLKMNISTGFSQSFRPGHTDATPSTRPLRTSVNIASKPPPTVLQLGGFRAGPSKVTVRQVGKWSTRDDIDEECVEQKLLAAKCLSRAREHGLPVNAIRLREFGVEAGLKDCAQALIHTLSRKMGNHDERSNLLRSHLKTFCQEFHCNFDESLLSYVERLCRDNEVSSRSIEEAASVARCCSSDEKKAACTLSVVRAGILCGYSEDWLLAQARQAIEWASSSSSLQCEMEEAARLLLIDCIISKYCGRGARELFRADNPRHAIKLLDFVVSRVKTGEQTQDILDLCDAFAHLPKQNAMLSVFRQGILKGNTEMLIDVLNVLYDSDATFADKVLNKVISFTMEMLSESSLLTDGSNKIPQKLKTISTKTSEISGELLAVALQRGRQVSSEFCYNAYNSGNGDSLSSYRDQFLRVHELQTRHDIFISLSDLQNPEKQISATMGALHKALGAFTHDDLKGFLTEVKKAERVCMLLAGRKSASTLDIWKVSIACVAESLVSRVDAYRFGKYLKAAGLFDGEPDGVACRGLLRLALSLCADHGELANEENLSREACEIALAASLVRDHAIHLSDPSTLPIVVDADSFLDPCHNVLTLTDNGHGDKIIQFRESIMTFSPNSPVAETLRACGDISELDVLQPLLHSSWYHGDGLLLPPEQTISMLKWFCRSTIRRTKNASQASTELQRLLSEKGSNFSRLRILNVFWSKFLVVPSFHVSEETCEEVTADFENSLLSLSERSIGGTDVGMTSGTIDSELSVSFLLSLPVKLAFKIYTSTIPTALRTQQYYRLSTLANIGQAICTGAAGAIPKQYQASAWTKQQKFLEQCKSLALQASWWIVFSKHGIEFDPGRFERPRPGENYALSLLKSCMICFAKDYESSVVIDILTNFARDFNIDTTYVVESYVEYILSPMHNDCSNASDNLDARNDLGFCTRVCKHYVRRLRPLDRARLLRRCVKRYELQEPPLTEYERFSNILCLYREALVAVLDKTDLIQSIDPVPFEIELELVDRRRDALEVLSSYFTGSSVSERPDFRGFFVPFAKIFGESLRVDHPGVLVIGPPREEFDPLLPLRKIMLSSNNVTSALALSPLCTALGLPQGYIRARFLMARFEMAAANDTTLPSFENDVEPVIDKLRSPKDKAELSEWIAEKYALHDEDRLKCYEIALNAAMQASSEIEFRRRTTPGLAELESESLEVVRRLTIAKGALSDKLRISAILQSGNVHKGSSWEHLIAEIVSALDGQEKSSPEKLVEFLLRKTSSLAAERTLNETESLSTAHFRELSTLINRVCVAMSEQHSHVDPRRQARLLASHWLFRGNTDSAEPVEVEGARPVVQVEQLASIKDHDDHDTFDFVLDLGELHQSDKSTGNAIESTEDRQTSEEEPSALRSDSPREGSEKDSHLASLRVAFVLASSVDKVKATDEAFSPRAQESSASAAKKRFGLLSKVEAKLDTPDMNDATRQIGRQLLQVAFAKKVFKFDAFNDSMHLSTSDIDGYNTKTITYAMRHRALRAASVLCPQELLEEICHDEGYLRLELEMRATTLRECSFGVFVAKEIEEMGLQLPHSDLPQLSSMNFPAYARTLWRHHRDASHMIPKGRLLLLLTEMALKEDVCDGEFMALLLKEMRRIVLPRTQLCALECIAKSQHCEACKTSLSCSISFWKSIESTANAVLSEAFSWNASDNSGIVSLTAITATIRRLARLMVAVCSIEQSPKLGFFIKVVAKLLGETTCDELKTCLASVLHDIILHQESVGMLLRSYA